jgi:F1F0 ATPase subunit 2
MNEVMSLIFVLIVGVFLGAIFFGGLWWTVQKGVSSPYAALWFTGSMFLRTVIVLGGFYFVGHANWQRLLICLLGFIIARFGVTRLTGPPRRLHES